MKFIKAPKPTLGEKRIIRKFAWLPKRINPQMTVWLERYQERQIFEVREMYVSGAGWCKVIGWHLALREELYGGLL